MAHRDIYISRIRFRGDRLYTGRSLAAEIRAAIDRRQLSGLIGHLRFVYVPSNAQPPFATAYVAFTRRDTHSAAVELLNGLIFRGQATLWRLGNNEPRRGDQIPPGAQYALDRPRPRPREPVAPRYFVIRRPGLVERLPTPPASPPPRDEPADSPERPNSPPPGQPQPARAAAVPGRSVIDTSITARIWTAKSEPPRPKSSFVTSCCTATTTFMGSQLPRLPHSFFYLIFCFVFSSFSFPSFTFSSLAIIVLMLATIVLIQGAAK